MAAALRSSPRRSFPGGNPYVDYDQPDSQPFLLDEKADDRLPPKERVTAVQTSGGSAVVYPFSRLTEGAVVEDRIDGKPVVVFYDPDVASSLDEARIFESDPAGSAAVFERRLDGQDPLF
jgi:hypothetical protein